jgi:hypothetical protein
MLTSCLVQQPFPEISMEGSKDTAFPRRLDGAAIQPRTATAEPLLGGHLCQGDMSHGDIP